MHGDAGNDSFFYFRGTAVTLHGGTGNDTYMLDVSNPANFVENAGEGTDLVYVPRGKSYTLDANFEYLTVRGYSGSTTGNATLNGNALNNVIRGHNNIETINGGDGHDILRSYGGNDVLDGGAGNDRLEGGLGDDTMKGGTGNDTYFVDSEHDTVTELGGQGTDTVRSSLEYYTLGANVENGVVLRAQGGEISGNGLDNRLSGGAGDDTIYGNAGDDVLIGGEGLDAMIGGFGDDVYHVDFDDGYDGANVIEQVDGGTDTVRYVEGGIVTMPDEVENAVADKDAIIIGNYLDNNMAGSSGGDTLGGREGNDVIRGAGGNDLLLGEGGNDTLDGGAGSDGVYGGAGADILTGGADDDKFYFDSTSDSLVDNPDVITDFKSAVDSLDLSFLDADTGVTGNQDFHIVSSFTGGYGELTVSEESAGVWGVRGDVNGDGVADFLILVHATPAFGADDILL